MTVRVFVAGAENRPFGKKKVHSERKKARGKTRKKNGYSKREVKFLDLVYIIILSRRTEEARWECIIDSLW